jgi:hypothetical protein
MEPGSCSRRIGRARGTSIGRRRPAWAKTSPSSRVSTRRAPTTGRRMVASSFTTPAAPRARAAAGARRISGWRRSPVTASRFRSWCDRLPTSRPRFRATGDGSSTAPTSPASGDHVRTSRPGKWRSRPGGAEPGGARTGELFYRRSCGRGCQADGGTFHAGVPGLC